MAPKAIARALSTHLAKIKTQNCLPFFGLNTIQLKKMSRWKVVKMPIEAKLSTPASNGMGHGAQHEDSTWDESSALLPNSPINSASVSTEATWGPQSLPPGFIWIETGTFCPCILPWD